MYCIHCGTKLDDDALFCTECGARVAEATAGAAGAVAGAAAAVAAQTPVQEQAPVRTMPEQADIPAGQRRLFIADTAEFHFVLAVFSLELPQADLAVFFILTDIVQITSGALYQVHCISSLIYPFQEQIHTWVFVFNRFLRPGSTLFPQTG